MPLRTRLSNTGLKLKIPVRSSSNGASAASPYGPSPNRHSASPHRRREEVFPLPVAASTCNNKADRGSQERVTLFDASVDSRPVWAVTSHKQICKISCFGWREVTVGTKYHWKILGTCGAVTFINKICSIVIDSYFHQPRVAVIMHYYELHSSHIQPKL